MVYCTKCGLKNEDDAAVCTQCGAPLEISRPKRRDRSGDQCFGRREKRWENECFGLPHGGVIAGLIFGIIIIIIGVAVFLGESVWQWLWPTIIVIFGLLIVLGALYSWRRRS